VESSGSLSDTSYSSYDEEDHPTDMEDFTAGSQGSWYDDSDDYVSDSSSSSSYGSSSGDEDIDSVGFSAAQSHGDDDKEKEISLRDGGNVEVRTNMLW
jgi:hypothetical protein